MIGYWKEFFYDPLNPETRVFIIDYLTWMVYAYPIFLLQLPFVTMVLLLTFKPEYRNLSRAVAKLRNQIKLQGPMKPSDWLSIGFFIVILLGWIFESGRFGMGTVAVAGASLFLIAGLVRWEDVNSGVNWGVVLLYAAAISLGVQMKENGCRPMVGRELPVLDDTNRCRSWHRSVGGHIGSDHIGHEYHVKWRCRRRARTDRS